jgi:HK97 family phage prohead protease
MASKSDTFKPTDGMKKEAERGLAWVKEYGRGGTNIGRGRATDIAAGRALSYKTVKRVKAYFDRHASDKNAEGWSPGEKGYPSNGRIAHALWGGDAGYSWAKAIVRRVEGAERKLEMSNETRSAAIDGFEVRDDEETGTRTLVGYMAKFNTRSQDLGGFVEVIDPTAFNRTLGNEHNDVVVTFNHNNDNLLGRRSAGTARIEADEVGVRYQVELDPEDPLHKRVERMLVRGDLTGSSFTFSVTADGQEWSRAEDGTRLRTLTQVRLIEGGPVTQPAYLDATAAIRSLENVVEAEEAETEEPSTDEVVDAPAEPTVDHHARRVRGIR